MIACVWIGIMRILPMNTVWSVKKGTKNVAVKIVQFLVEEVIDQDLGMIAYANQDTMKIL